MHTPLTQSDGINHLQKTMLIYSFYLFIYLLQTTVGPYTYRTVENTQYKAGNRIKKKKHTGITHETKKLKSKKLNDNDDDVRLGLSWPSVRRAFERT